MTRTAKLLLAAACAAAVGTAVQAQPQPQARYQTPGQPLAGNGSATLYELPNFQGRSITIYRGADNLQDSSFNDMAQSAHFDGDWTVCSDAGLRGNCQTLSGDVANLNRYGLGRMVSSLRKGDDDRGQGYGQSGYGQDSGRDRDGYDDNRGNDRGDDDNRGYGDDRGPRLPVPAGPGGWQGADGVPGRSVVFFARPQMRGRDIAAYDRSAADWFCRRQGLGAAVYYDTSLKSNQAFRWNNTGFAMNAPVLRDVVCRR